jgi:tetratricopeptide (TPR) repeat protein
MLRPSRFRLTSGLLCLLFLSALVAFRRLSFARPKQQPPTTGSVPQSTVTSLPSPLTDALALYRKGNFDEAITKYQGVLQDKPNSPDAYAGLIRTYLKKKDVQQAADIANQALQVAIQPRCVSLWVNSISARERSTTPKRSG